MTNISLLSVILSPEVLWLGLECHIGERLRFVSLTKVNSKYYCEQVPKPFLDNDAPRLFPDDPESMVFHQDSASSHTARGTIQFLKNNNMNFIDKKEWMPKSPDATPMDFGIEEILKCRLQKQNVNTLIGLKLDQKTINKTLESWPKRCNLIYRCHESHIEHLIQ